MYFWPGYNREEEREKKRERSRERGRKGEREKKREKERERERTWLMYFGEQKDEPALCYSYQKIIKGSIIHNKNNN